MVRFSYKVKDQKERKNLARVFYFTRRPLVGVVDADDAGDPDLSAWYTILDRTVFKQNGDNKRNNQYGGWMNEKLA